MNDDVITGPTPSVPTDPKVPPKPGYKTTEFWLTVLAWLIAILVDSGAFPEKSPILAYITTGGAILKSAGYSAGRAFVKTAIMLLAVGLALSVSASACTAAQGQLVKQQVIDCGKGALGKEVGQAVGAAAAAISSGQPAGAVAKGIAIGAGVNAIDFGVCVLSKLEADLAGKAFQDGAPAGAQVAVVLDAYLAEHPAAKARTYDVSRVAVSK